jgi:hypothetical protein
MFDMAVSTTEATEALDEASYDAIITDYGRRGSSDRSRSAGEDLIRILGASGPPIVVSTTRGKARELGPALRARGAFGVTHLANDLIRIVLAALGHPSPGEARPTGIS